MGFLDRLFGKSSSKSEQTIYGGDGLTPETAAIVNCASLKMANLIMDNFISKKHGKKDHNWKWTVSCSLSVDGPSIRRIVISTTDVENISYYFNVDRPEKATDALLKELGLYPKIDEHKMRQLRILIANSDDTINEGIKEMIKKIINDKYDLLVTPVWHGEEILNFAKEHPIDLFIMVINNIIFRSEDLSAELSIEKALWLIKFLRETYGSPVIALYGWPDDPLFPEKVKQAGANYCIGLPIKFEDLKKPIEECLELRVSE